jgi:hypothetical protein
MVTTCCGAPVAATVGTAVSTATGAGVAGSAGDWEVSGTAGVTEPVAEDWVQPAINIHAIITRKREIPEYLIHNFFFGKGIRLLAAARSQYMIAQRIGVYRE